MILSIDLGTTSISAVIFDPRRSEIVCSAECPNDAGIPGLPEGHHEQCATSIIETACALMNSLIRKSGLSPDMIDGAALTGQQHGIAVVDKDWKPLTNLITWRDQRTASLPEQLRRHPYAADTGCFLNAGYGGLTLHHLIQQGALPEGAHSALSVTGLLAAHLTGRGSIDETMAASWGILDVKSRQWHSALLGVLNIPTRLLPEIYPSCLALGPVVDPGSSGLAPGTMVFSPVGDNQSGFADAADGGNAVVNLGTSSQLSAFSCDYAYSPILETRPFPGGGFLHVYAALCGGWAYAYLAEFFQKVTEQIGGVALSLPEVFDRIQIFADSTESNGLCADTRFAGERNGSVDTGTISSINTTNFTPANLIRAFANGVAGELAGAAREMRFDGSGGLTVVGNAAHRNPLLVKALEQQFGIKCRLLASGGAEAALGAARLAIRLNS